LCYLQPLVSSWFHTPTDRQPGNPNPFHSQSLVLNGVTVMTDLNRGIMKFPGADSPVLILLSSLLILGGISVLLWWSYQAAYPV